jgi:tRNA pseudouridine55 synthase
MAVLQDPVFEWVLLVDKPIGITSHDIVDRLRRKLKMKKIGHAGTLDPLATGLMIILIGKATKVSQFLISLDKSYEGEFLLGVETNSQDADGEVVATKEIPASVNQEGITLEMKSFMGDQYQTPPMFSAKKIDGVPLYKMARKGKTVEREPRFIRINELTLTGWDSPKGKFFMECSKGTYVRTVFHDLGQNLECGAHLTALRRTRIDQFSIEGAKTLEEIELMPLSEFQSLLIPIHQAVPSHVL